MTSNIRSLRQIRIDMLKQESEYHDWRDTAEYIVPPESWWEQNPDQGECVPLTAAQVRVELANLQAMSDDEYQKTIPNFRPLSYWTSMSDLELGHYARLRRVEGREWSEDFPELGSSHFGMSGWDWFRLKEHKPLSPKDAERILGFEFAYSRAQAAADALRVLVGK